MIGGLIMAHGDDDGLVLPPRLAPYQAVIIPIGAGDAAAGVAEHATALAARLQDAGVRVHVDMRDERPGFKFNDWTLRGVPVRIELGPRDIESGQVLLAWRVGAPEGANERGKLAVPQDDLVERLPGMLEDIHDAILQRAEDYLAEHTRAVDDWDAFASQVAEGFAVAFHCGRGECEDDIKAVTAATPRCIPLDAAEESGSCVRCGQDSDYGKRVVFSRAY